METKKDSKTWCVKHHAVERASSRVILEQNLWEADSLQSDSSSSRKRSFMLVYQNISLKYIKVCLCYVAKCEQGQGLCILLQGTVYYLFGIAE